jgi:hypothetical protein
MALLPAVFVDRDGDISENAVCLNHPSRFPRFPFVADAIRPFTEAGLPVVVDVEPARNAPARGMLIQTECREGELAWHSAKWGLQPDFVAKDLRDATDWILRQPK